MRAINVRELRNEIPHLKETLAQEDELLPVSNGEPVARTLPVAKTRHVPSLASHRAQMKPLPAGSIAQAIREDRGRR